VKQVCLVLAVAAVTSSEAEAVASAIFSNHSLVAARLVSSEDLLVLPVAKTLKSLPIFHLNKRSLVPILP
jgi:hypothetical protein